MSGKETKNPFGEDFLLPDTPGGAGWCPWQELAACPELQELPVPASPWQSWTLKRAESTQLCRGQGKSEGEELLSAITSWEMVGHHPGRREQGEVAGRQGHCVPAGDSCQGTAVSGDAPGHCPALGTPGSLRMWHRQGATEARWAGLAGRACNVHSRAARLVDL